MTITDKQVTPCPFCGSTRITVQNIRDGAQPICKDCRAQGAPIFDGPEGRDATFTAAWKAWNTRAALEAADRVAADAAQAVAWCAPWQLDLVASLSVGQFASMELAKHESARFNTALYTTPPPPADDARDGGRILLRQAIDAMSKLRQSLEFPGEHGGLYVFPEHAVRKFTDEQARIMYEEKRLAGGTKGSFTDSDRLEFVMRKFPGSAARDAGITWGENTIDAYRAAIDRAMGAKDCE